MTARRRPVIFAILGAVVVLGAVGFVWVRRAATRLMEQGRVALEAGQRAGRSLTAAACVDTVFARHARTDASLGTQLNERLFFDGCLNASEPSPDMCTDVPPEGAIARVARWALQQCQARGLSDPSCPSLLLPLPEYCGRRSRSGS